MIYGGCECNKVTFSVTANISDFGHCHCSQCRRLHGAAYASFAGVTRESFCYTAGHEQVKIYASSAHNQRAFCANCGSSLMVIPRQEPDVFYLSMSAIESQPLLPTGYHAWVNSKAYWHTISDDLEQFPEDVD